MTLSARTDATDARDAKDALAPRMRAGDWDAFAEFFALGGITLTWVSEPAEQS